MEMIAKVLPLDRYRCEEVVETLDGVEVAFRYVGKSLKTTVPPTQWAFRYEPNVPVEPPEDPQAIVSELSLAVEDDNLPMKR